MRHNVEHSREAVFCVRFWKNSAASTVMCQGNAHPPFLAQSPALGQIVPVV